jgi:serine/threonine-protein kinase
VLADARQRRRNAYVGTIFGMRMNRISTYSIESILGEGATGVVFRATRDGDEQPGKWVVKALKLPGDSNSQAREAALQRFKNEAAIGQQLSHPGIAPIVDHGMIAEGAIPYLVMPFIHGKTLRQVLDSGSTMRPREACELLAQIADALAEVHRHRIVHRDIKPGNVLINEQGRAVLMDFSISRVADSSLTQQEMILGSPAYMAPEAFQGTGVDCRADLFSLGVMAYEMLTGERPFAGDSLARFAQVIPTEKPPAPSSITPAVTPAMERAVAGLLKKSPAERTATAAAAAAEFRAAVTAPPEADSPPSPDDWSVDE